MTEPRTAGTRTRRWVFGAELDRDGAAAVVRLRGRLSYAATGALDAALTDAVGRTGTDVLLDLAAVDYVSGGAALRLVALAEHLAARGGRLRLRGVQESVRRVLDYAGVLAHPSVVLDEPAAAEPVSGPPAAV